MECRVLSTIFDRQVDNSKRRLRLYPSTRTPERTEQNLFIRIGKSEAEVTRPNNERLRSRYCTVEANYRQTQSRGLSATAELLVFL